MAIAYIDRNGNPVLECELGTEKDIGLPTFEDELNAELRRLTSKKADLTKQLYDSSEEDLRTTWRKLEVHRATVYDYWEKSAQRDAALTEYFEALSEALKVLGFEEHNVNEHTVLANRRELKPAGDMGLEGVILQPNSVFLLRNNGSIIQEGQRYAMKWSYDGSTVQPKDERALVQGVIGQKPHWSVGYLLLPNQVRPRLVGREEIPSLNLMYDLLRSQN